MESKIAVATKVQAYNDPRIIASSKVTVFFAAKLEERVHTKCKYRRNG